MAKKQIDISTQAGLGEAMELIRKSQAIQRDTLPAEFWNEERVSIYLEKNPNCLDWVPVEFRTAEMCEKAVKAEGPRMGRYRGAALKGVPEHLKTAELCQIAVDACGVLLKYVPEHLKLKDLCIDALLNYANDQILWDITLKSVPEELCATVDAKAREKIAQIELPENDLMQKQSEVTRKEWILSQVTAQIVEGIKTSNVVELNLDFLNEYPVQTGVKHG